MKTNLTLAELRELMARWETRQGGIAKRWENIKDRMEAIEHEIDRVDLGDQADQNRKAKAHPRKLARKTRSARVAAKTKAMGPQAGRPDPGAKALKTKPGRKKKAHIPAEADTLAEIPVGNKVQEPAGHASVEAPVADAPDTALEPAPVESSRAQEPEAVAQAGAAKGPELEAPEHGMQQPREPDKPSRGPDLAECLKRLLMDSGEPMTLEELEEAMVAAGFGAENISDAVREAIQNGQFRETVAGVMLRETKPAAKPLAELL